MISQSRSGLRRGDCLGAGVRLAWGSAPVGRMARTKSAKLAPSSVVVADDAGTSTSKRQRLAEVAGKGDDFVAELNVRRELKLLIKEKVGHVCSKRFTYSLKGVQDAEYADLLAKYNALKESTLSQLNNSIDRLGSELDKLQSADTEPVIEHLQAEIASLNDQLQAARKAKLENVMLKNETTALHSKGRRIWGRFELAVHRFFS